MRIGPMLRFQVGLGAVCLVAACSGSEVDPTVAPDPDTFVAPSDTTADTSPDTAVPPDTVADAAPDTVADVAPDTVADVADAIVGPLQWESLPLGDLGVLSDVHAVSPELAYAVGGSRVLRFNGRTWAPFGDPVEDAVLHGVWADESRVVVVGQGGVVAVRGSGELGWTQLDAGVEANLHAVDARGPEDLWVVGADGVVMHFDGVEWATHFGLEGVDLHGLWIAPDSAGTDGIYAVGSGGQMVLHDGNQWRNEQIAVSGSTLSGVFGVDGALFAVGSGATITARLPGAAGWQGQTTNDTQERDLMAVTGTALDEVVAFGSGGVVIRFDGDKWTVDPVSGPFNSVADLVAADHVEGDDGDLWLVVASAGDGLTRVDGQWVDLFTQPQGGLKDIEGSAADALWAAGAAGLLMTTTAHGWTAVDVPVAADLNAVAVDDEATVWAVGDSGTIIRRASDGTLTLPDSQLPLDLYGVAVGDAGIVACGKGGTLLDISADGLSVTPRPSNAAADLQAVAFGGDGALWIAGNFGTLLRSADGQLPALVSSGVGGNLNDVVATDSGVLAAGDNGVVIEASEGAATLLSERPGVFLYGVSASTEAFAVGWNGTVLRREGDTFVREETGVTAVLEAVWNQGSEAVAAGRQGTFLRRLEAP